MDRHDNPLDYEGTADTPRPMGRVEGVVRAVFTTVGVIWFIVWVLGAVMGFLMRGLGNEPGSSITVPRALLGSFMGVVIGLLGLAIAVAAHRLWR